MAKGFHRISPSSDTGSSTSSYSASSSPSQSPSSSPSASTASADSSSMSKLIIHSQVRKLILEEELFVKLALGEAEQIRLFQQESMGNGALNRPSPLGLN